MYRKAVSRNPESYKFLRNHTGLTLLLSEVCYKKRCASRTTPSGITIGIVGAGGHVFDTPDRACTRPTVLQLSLQHVPMLKWEGDVPVVRVQCVAPWSTGTANKLVDKLQLALKRSKPSPVYLILGSCCVTELSTLHYPLQVVSYSCPSVWAEARDCLLCAESQRGSNMGPRPALLLACLLWATSACGAQLQPARSFSIENNTFVQDGKRVQLISGRQGPRLC